VIIPVEYALKALAVLVILWGLINVALLLLVTEVGIMALFVLAFAAVIAAFSGATLLAVGFLYQEVPTAGLSDLMLLVVPTSVASTLLVLGLEGPALRALRRLGVGEPWIGIGIAVAHGFVTASLLAVAACFVPGAGPPVEAVSAAGLIGAFALHYIELVLTHAGPVGGGDLALPDTDLEEED
jgi:hypothetical protein